MADLINQLIEWYAESGLAQSTAQAVGRIVTYTANELIPLMWEYINTLFPNGGVF